MKLYFITFPFIISNLGRQEGKGKYENYLGL